MQAFERSVGFLLAISLWSGITAQIAPLPEENMNVVRITFWIVFLLHYEMARRPTDLKLKASGIVFMPSH